MTTDTVRAPAESPRRTSRGLRQLVPWLLAVAVATCTQDNLGPSHGGTGYFSFRPVYPMAGGASLSQFGIVADSVHVRLTRPVDQIVIDTTVPFPADSTQLRLALPVELAASPEVLTALIEISAGGVVIFRDSLDVTVKDGAPGNTPPPTVTFDYVGPGSNIATLSILPGDTTVTLGDTLFFTAGAVDSFDVAVPDFYVGWKTSDTSFAKINGAGRLIAPNLRGTLQVIGVTPTGIADTTTVTFAPVPVIITADSGDLQVAQVGDSLGALFVARVKGADSLGISGIPVRFQAITAGGAVRDTLVITDAQGRARTRALLGTLAGNYSYTATPLGTGLPAWSFTATATATAATAIAIQGGNAQVDTVAQLLPLPLVVHVTDAFTNPVAGAPVVFATTFGNGTIADDTVFTDASGNAGIGYTLDISIGTDSITATIAGTSASVVFHATGIADAPVQTQEFGGGNQTVAVNTAYPESLLVKVFDSHDNPVAGATVVWSIFAGQGSLALDTTLTDSTGSARNALTAGTLAGALQVEVRALPIVNGITITNYVTAGAPATMVIGSGNAQSGPAGIALPLSPEVIVRDSFSNAVPGVTVDFAVVAGGGTIDSATATTDSTGRANSGLWTLGLAGLNTVRATASTVPADTLLFDATALPAGTSKLWTGASTGSWADANSWEPVGVPGITDNVFIPASAPNPLVGSATTIGDLSVEAGATLIVDAQLTVSGDATVDGTVSGSAALTLTGSGTALHGTFTNPQVNVNGTPLLDGATTLSGALTVGSGLLAINGRTLTVGGDLTLSGSGQLGMTATGDSVDVTGNVTYSTATTGAGSLTAGTLVIRGDLTQSAGGFANFSASGTHTTRFLGAGTQTVSFSSPGAANSHFQNVEFGSASGITLGSNIVALGTTSVSAGTVTGPGRTAFLTGDLVTGYAGWQVATTQFDATPALYPDSLPRNVVLNAAFPLAHPFTVDSNLTITATGVFTANGHALRVGGALSSNGVFRMQNSADTVDVAKQFTVNGSLSGVGDLTGGVLILRGGLVQSAGGFDNFQPSGSHTVRFEGTTGQSASFASPSASNSRFQNVEFADSVNFSTALYVAGSTTILAGGKAQSTNTATLAGALTDPTNLGWRYANTLLPGTVTTLPDSMVTNLTLAGSWTLAAPVTLAGNLTLNSGSLLTANGHRLAVSGTLTQGGRLQMLLPADTVEVGGAFTVGSATAGTGDLVDGRLILRGGFTQSAGSFQNFAPSAGHVTEFAGTGGHPISMASPSSANSHFNHLVVSDSLTAGTSITVTGNTTLTPTGRVVGTATGFLDGDLVDSSLAGWRMANTTFSGGFQSIPESLFTNVTLNDSIALAQPTTVIGNFTLVNNGYIAFSGHGLGVSGNFTQNAQLGMNSTQDSLDVGGSFTVSSSGDGTGDLAAGVIVLRGGFTQTAGSFTNFVGASPHRVRFTGAAARTISMATPAQTLFGDLEIDATGAITLANDVRALGTLKVTGGATLTSPATQRLLRTGQLAIDGLTLDRVRIQSNSPSVNAAQFDNVTFTNIDPTLTQLTLELPGLTGDTLKFTNVTFSGTPTSGRYLYVADSVANDAPAVIGFYNSTPLNGALFTAVEGTVGDPATILWTHLDWITQPSNAVELLAMVAAPQVGVYDPSNVLLSGYSGTVSLGFGTDPSGGSAVLAGNSVTATGGVATFDSLTVSLAGVGYTLVAGNAELGQSPASAPFTIDIPLPVGTTTAFNNGGGDNLWENAANWTSGTPDSADNVYIFPGQTASVNAPAQVNRLVVGSGGGIVLNATLTADSSVDAGNTITGGGSLVAAGSGTLAGTVGDLQVTGTYVAATGNNVTAQNVTVSGSGELDPGSSRIDVGGALILTSGGRLTMADPSARVVVQGSTDFGGSASSLSDGILEVRGDVTVSVAGSYQPAGNFVLLFTGSAPQGVVTNYLSILPFGALGNVQVAADSVTFFGTTVIDGFLQLDNGTAAFADTLVMNGSVYGTTSTLRGTVLLNNGNLGNYSGIYAVGNTVYSISGGITPLTYDTLTVASAASLGQNIAANQVFVVDSGALVLGGHRLDVTGDFGTGQYGRFAMTSPADTLIVGGNFTAGGGSTTGLLTAGLLQVSGNFVQGMYTGGIPVEVVPPIPATDAFKADVGHVTRLVGGALPRLVYFDNPVQPPGSGALPTDSSSQFGTLELVDGLDTLASVVPVAGTTTVGAVTLQGGTLASIGKITVAPTVVDMAVSSLYSGGGLDYQASGGTFNVPETFFFGGDSIPVLPYQWLRVGFAPMALTGDVTAAQVTLGGQGEFSADSYGGLLDLNGHALTSTGDFTVTGHALLQMAAAGDSLDVGGAFNYAGDDATGLLTDGVIVARGDAYASANWTDTSFAASGQHRFRMEPTAGSAILAISQGPTRGIAFNKFTIAAGATVNYDQFTDGELVARDSLYVDGSLVQAGAGRLIVARGPMFVSTGGNLQVDTLQLHQTVDVGDAGFDVLVMRYAGAGQLLDGLLSYQELEVTGTATVTASTSVFADARVLRGGRLDIGAAALNVTRTFSVLDSADLGMADPGAVLTADTARFAGASTVGDLTAGTLRTRALFQSSVTNDSSYAPSGTFLTQVGTAAGGTEYRIEFENADGASHLQDLRLDDGGQVIVPTRIVGRVTVAGKMVTVPQGSGGVIGDPGAVLAVFDSLIINDAGTSITLDTLELYGASQVANSTLDAAVVRFAGAGQAIPDTQNYNRLEVTGTAAPEGNGTITANTIVVLGNGRFTLGASQSATTSGDFSTLENGTLEMNGANSSLFISGNATFAGGNAVGLLTDGVIRVAGNFSELPGSASETFTSSNTGVQFLGSSGTQVVTLDPSTIGNFRAIGVTNPNGIQINGLMIVTDSVGTSGPITGDSLYQFGTFFMNSGAQVALKVLQTAGLFSGAPSLYSVGRTTIRSPNSLPNVAFDTLVVNANGVSAFYPISANVLIVAASGSPYASGPDGVLDLGVPATPVTHNITGDVRVEGAGASLLLAEDTLLVGGNFGTALGGTLTMDDPNGLLQVSGSTVFGGASQIGKLTAGRLFIGGDLAQQASTSPSSLRVDGATVEFGTLGTHKLSFATPDSSFLPQALAFGNLDLLVVGRARITGPIDGNGVTLSGDTLWTDAVVNAGSSQLQVALRMYRGPVFDQFTQMGSYNVGTTQFIAGGSPILPQYDFVFDTLVVSDSVEGRLSQLLKVARVEVTGPGNPRHVGPNPGSLVLVGNDGNTLVDVAGDVLVRGAGAAIYNNDQGRLQVAGDLTVDQDAVLASNGSFGIPTMSIGGSVRIDGASTAGLLATGALEIGGDFIQGASSSTQSYAPAPAHVTRFTGSGTHRVVFATPSMAQSHFGSFSIDTGATAPNTVDLQTWAFADSLAVYGVGAAFQPVILGNGNRLTSGGGYLLGAALDGVHLQFEDGASFTGPNLGNLKFTGYSAFTVPQITLNTGGGWQGIPSWATMDFDDAGPNPWLVVNNSGVTTVVIDVHTPDVAALPSNVTTSGGPVTVNALP